MGMSNIQLSPDSFNASTCLFKRVQGSPNLPMQTTCQRSSSQKSHIRLPPQDPKRIDTVPTMTPSIFRWTVPLAGSTRGNVNLSEKKDGGFGEAADENAGPRLSQERYFVDRVVEVAKFGSW